MQDNLDLPMAFVADTLVAMAEARTHIHRAARLAGLGGSEPGITAGRVVDEIQSVQGKVRTRHLL
ncbi:hypothetical protein ADM96_11935 [Burkholderia sp. ST111]|nr:hypothetical protein ADM96_11935 [Burkholderia sp. ST111]